MLIQQVELHKRGDVWETELGGEQLLPAQPIDEDQVLFAPAAELLNQTFDQENQLLEQAQELLHSVLASHSKSPLAQTKKAAPSGSDHQQQDPNHALITLENQACEVDDETQAEAPVTFPSAVLASPPPLVKQQTTTAPRPSPASPAQEQKPQNNSNVSVELPASRKAEQATEQSDAKEGDNTNSPNEQQQQQDQRLTLLSPCLPSPIVGTSPLAPGSAVAPTPEDVIFPASRREPITNAGAAAVSLASGDDNSGKNPAAILAGAALKTITIEGNDLVQRQEIAPTPEDENLVPPSSMRVLHMESVEEINNQVQQQLLEQTDCIEETIEPTAKIDEGVPLPSPLVQALEADSKVAVVQKRPIEEQQLQQQQQQQQPLQRPSSGNATSNVVVTAAAAVGVSGTAGNVNRSFPSSEQFDIYSVAMTQPSPEPSRPVLPLPHRSHNHVQYQSHNAVAGQAQWQSHHHHQQQHMQHQLPPADGLRGGPFSHQRQPYYPLQQAQQMPSHEPAMQQHQQQHHHQHQYPQPPPAPAPPLFNSHQHVQNATTITPATAGVTGRMNNNTNTANNNQMKPNNTNTIPLAAAAAVPSGTTAPVGGSKLLQREAGGYKLPRPKTTATTAALGRAQQEYQQHYQAKSTPTLAAAAGGGGFSSGFSSAAGQQGATTGMQKKEGDESKKRKLAALLADLKSIFNGEQDELEQQQQQQQQQQQFEQEKLLPTVAAHQQKCLPINEAGAPSFIAAARQAAPSLLIGTAKTMAMDSSTLALGNNDSGPTPNLTHQQQQQQKLQEGGGIVPDTKHASITGMEFSPSGNMLSPSMAARIAALEEAAYTRHAQQEQEQHQEALADVCEDKASIDQHKQDELTEKVVPGNGLGTTTAAATSDVVPMLGFVTAKGAAVTISKEKLEAAKRMFGNISDDEGDDTLPNGDLHKESVDDTNSGGSDKKRKQPSPSSPTKKNLPVAADVPHNSKGDKAEESPKQRQRLLSPPPSNANNGSEEKSQQAQHEKEESLQAVTKDDDVVVPMLGFTTGHGAAVTISKAKLEAAKRMFGDLDTSNDAEIEDNTTKEIKGVQCDNNGPSAAKLHALERRNDSLAMPDGNTPALRRQMLRSRLNALPDTPIISSKVPADHEMTPGGFDAITPLPAHRQLMNATKTGTVRAAAGAAAVATMPGVVVTPRPVPSSTSSAHTSISGGLGSTGGVSASGAVKRRGKFVTPRTIAPLRHQGNAAGGGAGGGAGRSRLAAASKPSVQLHSLEGSLLKTTIASLHSEQTRHEGDVQIAGSTWPPLPLDSKTAMNYRISCAAGLEGGGDTSAANTVGWQEMRQTLIAAGANPDYASEDWVKNHYRWVVWKLARCEFSRGSPARGKLLTPGILEDELRIRYEREFNRGHRPWLKAVLQHDEPAAALGVLLIAHISLEPPTSLPNNSTTTTAAPGGSAVVLEVTDGWYAVPAVCDPHLSRLARSGNLLPGMKIRISGADLVSPGPSEPLKIQLHNNGNTNVKGAAVPSTALRLKLNGTHRVKDDTKLGRQPHRFAFLPLPLIHNSGGTVPQTMVVVLRRYPALVWARLHSGVDVYRTLKSHAATQRAMESALATAEAEAVQEVKDAETERCKKWLKSGKPGGMTQVDRLYATAIVAQASSGGSTDFYSSLNSSDRAALERKMTARQGELESEKRDALRRRTAALCAVPDKATEMTTFLVGSVTLTTTKQPQEVDAELRTMKSTKCTSTTAVMTVSGGCEEVERIKEGEIYAVSAVDVHPPGPDWALEPGINLLLKPGRRSLWKKVAASSAELLSMSSTNSGASNARLIAAECPRALCDISRLSALAAGQEKRLSIQHQTLLPPLLASCFDFLGVVLGLGVPHVTAGVGGEYSQWIFLADASVPLPPPSSGDAITNQEKPRAIQNAALHDNTTTSNIAKEHKPWLLAVCLKGTAESIDWLDPGSDEGALLAFKDLKLMGVDPTVKLWQAEGRQRTAIIKINNSHTRGAGVNGGKEGGKVLEELGERVAEWALKNAGFVAVLQQRIEAVMKS